MCIRDNPQTPSEHPWYRSQATWYNRDEHREGDPYHDAWIHLTRAVNQAARAAIKDVRQNPITDHRMLFQYIAAATWRAAEKHLPNILQSQPLHTPSPFTERGTGGEVLQGVEAGATHTDAPSGTGTAPPGPPHLPRLSGEEGSGKRTDARPALINAQQHTPTHTPSPFTERGTGGEVAIDLWEIEKRYMQSIRQRAEEWRNKYWR